MAELRASHAKLVTDSKSKETAHSSSLGKKQRSEARIWDSDLPRAFLEPSLPRLTERLQYIEQLLGDSASKHAQDDGVFGGKQLTAHGS